MSLDFVAKIGGFIRQGCWLGQVDGLFFSHFFREISCQKIIKKEFWDMD
jgi:hypothetical protein